MAVNPSCSASGDKCSEPGGRIIKGFCLIHYTIQRRANQPRCSIDGCEKPMHSMMEQLCDSHLRFKRLYGDPEEGSPYRTKREPGPCSVPGCGELERHLGMCSRHYQRNYRLGSPTAGGTGTGEPANFLLASLGRDVDECILWPYATLAKGYGVLSYNGKRWVAHRLALILAEGEPPDPKMQACHKPGICNTPSCVNPRHLYWGDGFDNQADRVIDGTSNQGERSATAKLWGEAIHQIRHVDLRPDYEVALDYGVTASCIQSVRSYRTWKHLP